MLKLGVQPFITPALSKACHPHICKEQPPSEATVYTIFQLIQQLLRHFHSRRSINFRRAQLRPGSSGVLAMS